MSLERMRDAWVCISRAGILLMLLCQPVFASEGSRNPYYQEALRLYDALEYEAALLMLESAAWWSSSDRAEQVSIALLEGVLAFEAQQPERARSAFRKALALDPAARLMFSVSPKILAELEDVRTKVLASAVPVRPQEDTPKGLQPAQAQEAADSPVQLTSASTSGSSKLRLPAAIGGGVIAMGGVIAWSRARSLEARIGNADPSIVTPQHLQDAVHQGRTFERVGWLLMGLGVATTAGSLLLLDRVVPGSKVAVTPEPGGASLSASWSLP